MLAGIGVGEGLIGKGTRVSVGGSGTDVAVSTGVFVLVGIVVAIGCEVADGIDVFVSGAGWKGVAVEVEFGPTVTSLKSGTGDVGAT